MKMAEYNSYPADMQEITMESDAWNASLHTAKKIMRADKHIKTIYMSITRI